jgi:hypothetical protein
MENICIIYPKGGLCNKLRCLFSYYLACKKNNKKLIVIWDITEECPGFFLDYFEPIVNVIFFKNNILNLKLNYIGCGWHDDFNPYCMNIFSELKLLSIIMNEVKEKLLLLENNFIAIHVRRTDHINLAIKSNNYTSDEDFFEFIEQYNDSNLYIATDNKDTFDLFYNKYNNKIRIPYTTNIYINKLRQTSLKDAIIDLYVCAHSKKFKGSGWSSFSSTILFIKDNL